jgi:hypothetical protein
VNVIGAGGGRAGQFSKIAGEAGAVGCGADQVLRFEFVRDPEGDFAGGIVAQEEEVVAG